MGNKIIDSLIEWLKDDGTGDVVGYKRKDGTERGIVTTEVNQVTGGISLSCGQSALAKRPRIAFLGDSNTQYAIESGGGPSPAFLGAPSWVVFINTDPFCPNGAGALSYYAASKTVTWQAAGDTVGAAVALTKSALLTLPSGTVGKGLIVGIRYDNLPASDSLANVITIGLPHAQRRNAFAYPVVAHMLCGAGFDYKIYGLGSGNSAQIRDIADQIISDGGYDMVVDQTGTNDVGGLISTAAAVAAKRATYSKLIAAGFPVLALSVPPRGDNLTGSGADIASRLVLAGINNDMSAYQHSVRGLYYLPTFNDLVNTQDSVGTPITNALQTDSVHTQKAAYYIGKSVAAFLSAFFPLMGATTTYGNDLYDATSNPYGNQIPSGNGTFLGAGGTNATDASLPGDGWGITRDTGAAIKAVCSLVAYKQGQARQFVVSGAVATPEILAIGRSATLSVTPGQLFKASAAVSVSGTTGLRGVALKVSWNGTGGDFFVYGNSLTDRGARIMHYPDGEAWSGVIDTGPDAITVPPGATSCVITILISTDAAGSATVVIPWVSYRFST